MAKKITHYLIALTIVAIILAIVGLAAYAEEVNFREDTDFTGNGAYALVYYGVDIVVNEDNTFDITEKIAANFIEERHGIIRQIPLRNEVVRLDGTVAVNRARLSEVRANVESSMSTEGDNKAVRIGNPNETVTGITPYRLEYKYDIGKDTGKGYDEFYFNIIGPEWDTTISNVSFNITMPKEFEAGKVGFSHGRVGSVDSSKVVFSVNGNTISGYYDGVLQPGEALTIRLELPEGYFVESRGTITRDWLTIFSFVVPIACVLVAFAMWWAIGRDEPVFETVEFYPPEGLSSADVGFAYRGIATYNDVVSLLIYLANKGYLRIEEYEEKVMFAAQKSYRFVKLKDYQGFDKREEDFLKGLFAEKDEVAESELQFKFHETVDKVLDSYNTKDNRAKLFYRNSTNKNVVFGLMMLAMMAVLVIRPVMEGIHFLVSLVGVLFPAAGLGALVSMAFPGGDKTVLVNGRPKRMSNIGAILLGLIFFLSFTGLSFFMLMYSWGGGNFFFFLDDKNIQLYIITLVIGAVACNSMTFFTTYMPKRTPYGNEILGKIKGFKYYLETVEKPRLEAMVTEDAEYFYNILPYAYVLEVSDKWVEKFESIALSPPGWYGGGAYDISSFGRFMEITMASAVAASLPPIQSSGGSGGGSGG
ncbi:MAG: DUF2207 domain-containing protein, partial [Lachnospiraceae bacterium]|nr:DUF2207 domain-containing protein [Lachnospiraceae bacterium]